MLPYDSQRIVERAEKLADTASDDLFATWIWGIAAAVALAGYGVWCLVTRSVHFVEGRPLEVVVYHGGRAIALGVAYVSAGLFLNLHYFWSWRAAYQAYAQIGKGVALLGVAGGIGYFIFAVLILG